MLRYLILQLLWFGSTAFTLAQVEVSFAEAERELVDGDYAHAADLLDSLETRGRVSANFYLALGNARFEAGQAGPAILAYERGLRLRPGSRDLENNLRYVRQQSGITTSPVPEFFLLRWWRVAGAAFGTLLAYGLSILCWWLAVAGVVYWYLRRAVMEEKRRFTLLPAAAGALVLAVGFFLLAQSRYAFLHQDQEAVLVAPVATLRVSPTLAGSVEAELEGGHKVRILDAVNEYVKVQLEDGRQGYLRRAEIAVI